MDNSDFRIKPTALVVASLFGLVLAGPATAQGMTTDKQAGMTKQAATSKNQQISARQARASKLIGHNVRSAQGENLGEIKDIVLDVANGRVHYVVVSSGGVLGLGDKLFAYPLRAFKHAADKDDLALTVDNDKLKRAPGFDAKAYPDWNAPDYRTQVDRHFGGSLAQPAGSKGRFVRASELIGKDVNDPDGRDLGEIQDVVVNLATGDVRYAVLEFDQSWSLKDKLFAFPLRAFKVGPQWKDDLVLNVTKERLNNTAGFAKGDWPNMNINDPKWLSDVDRALVATTAAPMTAASSHDAAFKRLDSNGDGMLSADEVKADAGITANWKKLDTDNNGRVSRSEFNAGHRK